MPKESAGLLMYRWSADRRLQVLLVHPGGPYWRKKDLGAWSLPKGEIEGGDDPLMTAKREFQEETGIEPQPPFAALGTTKLASSKRIHAWTFEGDCDPRSIQSNVFSLEWPPPFGQTQEFPEVDKADWFEIEAAKEKINPGQIVFLDTLVDLVASSSESWLLL